MLLPVLAVAQQALGVGLSVVVLWLGCATVAAGLAVLVSGIAWLAAGRQHTSRHAQLVFAACCYVRTPARRRRASARAPSLPARTPSKTRAIGQWGVKAAGFSGRPLSLIAYCAGLFALAGVLSRDLLPTGIAALLFVSAGHVVFMRADGVRPLASPVMLTATLTRGRAAALLSGPAMLTSSASVACGLAGRLSFVIVPIGLAVLILFNLLYILAAIRHTGRARQTHRDHACRLVLMILALRESGVFAVLILILLLLHSAWDAKRHAGPPPC